MRWNPEKPAAIDSWIGAYKRYLLGLLLIILAFNQVDRLVLGLVLQDIKIDLALSDTQLGFLGGIAFALFYAVMGIPIARWADRGDRVAIISSTAALWSVAVALCGVVGSFLQLLLVRVAAAVGEAGCIPPAHSLIADYFTRAQRPRAVAIYMLGGSLSVVIGYFAAGWLNEFYGWRATFVLTGLPGVALAALAWFTLREPRREGFGVVTGAVAIVSAPATAAARSSRPGLKEVCSTLWANTTFRNLVGGLSVVYLFSYGILQWQPAFFVRSYALHTGELGTWFATVYGLGGLLGTYIGGELASRYAANNERLQLKGMAVAYAIFGTISAFTYLSSDYHVAFALLGLASVGVYATTGPLFAMIQTLVPRRMRATSIAIVYLFANLIGMGLGPLIAGGLSDALRPIVGNESLRYALLFLCLGYFGGVGYLWRASRSVIEDLRFVQESDNDVTQVESIAPIGPSPVRPS